MLLLPPELLPVDTCTESTLFVQDKYKDNEQLAFGDVIGSKSRVTKGPNGGAQNPGAGGWPTIRYYNKGTGYDGAAYQKKTKKSMCDELGGKADTHPNAMEDFVVEFGLADTKEL